MSLPQKRRASPAEGEFLFELDPEPLQEAIAAYGGIPVFLRAVRSLDVGVRAKRHLQLKQRQRGFDESSNVESFLVLNALGGEFLFQFHDEREIEQAQRELPAGQVNYIPEESAALRGLAQVNQEVVQEMGSRCADQKCKGRGAYHRTSQELLRAALRFARVPQKRKGTGAVRRTSQKLARAGLRFARVLEKIATIDVDATVIESWKEQAQPTYQGGHGYQPVLTLWAENGLNTLPLAVCQGAVADEFRDSNVPAHSALLPIT